MQQNHLASVEIYMLLLQLHKSIEYCFFFQVDCMASDQVCLLETMPFQPVSVKTNDKPKEELEEAPPLVGLFIFTISVVC